MDLISTISEGAMKLMFDLNGWQLTTPFVHNDVAYVKPDFYPDRFIIGVSKRGYIYASGESRILYRGTTFTSIEELLNQYTKSALNDFNEWKFLEEKEWVITRDGQEFLYSFTTLDKLPKASKLRC